MNTELILALTRIYGANLQVNLQNYLFMLHDLFTHSGADVKLLAELPVTCEELLSGLLMKLNDLNTRDGVPRIQLHVRYSTWPG